MFFYKLSLLSKSSCKSPVNLIVLVLITRSFRWMMRGGANLKLYSKLFKVWRESVCGVRVM